MVTGGVVTYFEIDKDRISASCIRFRIRISVHGVEMEISEALLLQPGLREQGKVRQVHLTRQVDVRAFAGHRRTGRT
jgi:hypothetical protein